MLKKYIRIMQLLLFTCAVGTVIFFYSVHVSIYKVDIIHETLFSKKINNELNNLTFAFISDIQYLPYMDKARLTTMIDEFNKTKADFIIFGGDIFYQNNEGLPSTKQQEEMIAILKQLKAPLGKFAVLGDQDQRSLKMKDIIEHVLYEADFENITNKNIRIRNHGNESITLIGLDSLINGQYDAKTAFDGVNPKEFNILVTHCPDLLKKSDINTNGIDIALAGHSLGGQVCLPLFGSLRAIEGAKSYERGIYNINSTKLYVSNGLGTKDNDIRLFCPPEIHIFQLQSR